MLRKFINSVDYRLVRPLTGRDARNWATKTDFKRTYKRFVKNLGHLLPYEEGMKLAVGGEFEALGILEREALIHHGLKKTDYLIDVGCGSGRLAKPLSEDLTGKYLGIDVVPALVQYAQKLVQRPDWRFEVAEGLTIPESDGAADLVCFFSVLTHLLHEQSYVYLKEARRVLKPGGKIVVSFLDFQEKSHWYVFENSVKDIGVGANPLNVFMSEGMLREWARRLDLEVESIVGGDQRYFRLSQPVVFQNGDTMSGLGSMGQSMCVLIKK